MQRGQALSIDDAGRDVVLAECAAECETFIGRLIVPAARTIETILQIDSAPLDPLPLLPRWPDVAGVTLTGSVAERWESGAWASAPGSLRPAGRFALDGFRPGEHRLTVTATPDATMPGPFVEGVARLYAMRTQARPADNATETGTGATFNLSAAILRSGPARCCGSFGASGRSAARNPPRGESSILAAAL